MQKDRCHFSKDLKLQLIVSIKFHPFPSRYLFAIYHQKLFRLWGWDLSLRTKHDLFYSTVFNCYN